ncbi:hypothetical protein [Neisseria weaveri]|uniref:Uncharacterized protein n=1 Tax=Neisseria weaveri TaxID=28091 RepID=A0A3S5B1J0_9NEIS|nr:hypothetical protein [Neisseria weaveri]EGV36268.1 hypothetical protein l11_18270 [Neisseria weaveri LMG 5135]VEJ49104.1 Uncharacterised protein [Neisseria weaveri]
MLLAGFVTPTTVFLTESYERDFLNDMFKKLNKFIKKEKIDDGDLISDRLYRRYIRFSEVEKAESILRAIEIDFLNENEDNRQRYQMFFDTFYKCAEEMKYLLEIGREYGRLQIGLVELPYSAEEKQLSNEYYDSLPSNVEPVWMRSHLLINK